MGQLCLFVGGESDGRWVEVPEGMTRWQMPKKVDALVTPVAEHYVATINCSSELYQEQFLVEAHEVFRVFVYDPTPGKLIRTLLAGYRRKK